MGWFSHQLHVILATAIWDIKDIIHSFQLASKICISCIHELNAGIIGNEIYIGIVDNSSFNLVT
jgi:hypothetical protein